MAFKKPTAQSAVPDSPDRLFRDLPRRKHASLFDHQGQVLRTNVAEATTTPDTVEPFVGPIKSFTPDAKAAYQNADRVAVTTYRNLFNTNPSFDSPEIIIVDDAHASENYIADLWTVRIRRFLMSRIGANLLFNERVQTRVLQAVGRCTRGLNDYSAVVVTGEDLPAYLTDHKRRRFFHPELQAELEFGIDQSTGVSAADIIDNFRIFLEHDTRWEEPNAGILDTRDKATQDEFPAMKDLAAAVPHEIAWQKAMWQGDYAKAFDAARDVLGKLNELGLRGYRALWHYLAGSAAELAARDGDAGFEAHARAHFRQAKDASSGISWLIGLARGGAAPTPDERDSANVMLQVERLEAHLQKLGTLHNRSFSAREKEIREGLRTADGFRAGAGDAGRTLGLSGGQTRRGRLTRSVVVRRRRRDRVRGSRRRKGRCDARRDQGPSGCKPSRLASRARPGHGRRHDPIRPRDSRQEGQEGRRSSSEPFRALGPRRLLRLGDTALDVVRELRRTFVEPGDLAWHAEAAARLEQVRADAPSLARWLSGRLARDHLKPVA